MSLMSTFLLQPAAAFSPTEVIYVDLGRRAQATPVRYRRDSFDDAWSQLARAVYPKEDDDFLNDTPAFAAKAKSDGSEEAPRSYSYSMSSSSVTVNGETRSVVRKRYRDGSGGSKVYEERALRDDERILKESKFTGLGEDEAKVTYEGADGAEAFAEAWAPKAALEAASADDGPELSSTEAVAPTDTA